MGLWEPKSESWWKQGGEGNITEALLHKCQVDKQAGNCIKSGFSSEVMGFGGPCFKNKREIYESAATFEHIHSASPYQSYPNRVCSTYDS